MFALILEWGIVTRSWYAWLALRRRVSMSAIGSVMVIGCQTLLAVVPAGRSRQAFGEASNWLPGSLGNAGQFATVRHLADAHPAQPELAVDGLRPPATLAAGVRAHRELRLARRLEDQRLLRHGSALLEREAQQLQQRPALVVRLRGGHDGDVHAPRAIDPVLVDLVEHRLLGEPERVVAVAVELAPVESAEVTDTRQCDRQQPVEELPHPVVAQGHLRADRHALAQLELRDRLGRAAHLRLLAGDGGQVLDRAVDELGVAGGLADTHVDHDLDQTGDLHRVAVVELLAQLADDLVAVPLLEAERYFLGGRRRHHRSLPLRRGTRTFWPLSSSRYPM